MFINTHTHQRIHDARVELVNTDFRASDKPDHCSYGIHPWFIDRDGWENDLEVLERSATEKRCLAIGECGLDKLSGVDLALQEKVFAAQVQIANRVRKPLIIHCVKAFNELLNVLNHNDNAVPVIVHGYNNNENIARVLQDNGCYFSFGKALIGYDSNASRAIRNVGRKRFFLETDDADISIRYLYRKAAVLLGIDDEILEAQIKSNFETVFNISL